MLQEVRSRLSLNQLNAAKVVLGTVYYGQLHALKHIKLLQRIETLHQPSFAVLQ